RPRSAAQPNPRVTLSLNGDVRTTGREGSFILKRRRQLVCGHTRPGPASVRSSHDAELPINRITDDEAMVRIPEAHSIKKGFRVIVAKLQLPGRAGVRGFVDP